MTRNFLKIIPALVMCLVLAATQTSLAETVDPNQNAETRHGYILVDASTGEVLSQKNADELFIPASLVKISTAVMALNTLGTERRFSTRLVADGPIIDGILQGDLHLVGSGDPSLKTSDIKKLVTKLGTTGITRVAGQFIYDASALPQTDVIERTQPFGATYNPPVSGLNVDLNLRTANGQRLAIRKPGLRAAQMLRSFASQKGITLPDPAHSANHAVGAEIATHRSKPVLQLIGSMMESSNNLTAEALGVLAAASTGQSPQTLAQAARVTSDWVKAEAGYIDGKGWAGFHMVNHSGLTTRSRATPRQIAAILKLGYHRFGRTFTDLHSSNQPAGYQAYSLRGKFGVLKFVRGYGGFLTIGSREMIFAIMTDHRRNRTLIDAGKTGLNSSAWMNKADRFEKSVLSEWLVDFWQVE